VRYRTDRFPWPEIVLHSNTDIQRPHDNSGRAPRDIPPNVCCDIRTDAMSLAPLWLRS
jgi:hypothetical protein